MAIENNQYEILGAHLGGVHEALWTTKEGSKRTSRSLKYVVSPHDRGGSILAGGAAERSRVGLGLPWPPEAQIITGESIGRVPVPILWRGLTQDRNGRSEWTVGQIRTRYADLLAAHIMSAVQEYPPQQELILTIPDAFSQYSQQRLLESLARSGRHNVRLLWNPIALSLAWLESLGQQLKLKSDRDSLLVINVGPGSIDCNSFRLRDVDVNGVNYVAPIRRGGQEVSLHDGFDLAVSRVARALEGTKNTYDVQAHWFCLSFIDAWNPLASRAHSAEKIWNQNGTWEVLPKDFFNDTLATSIETRSTEEIENLLRASEGASRALPESEKWGDLVTRLIENELARSDDVLRGAIVSGFPFGFRNTEWAQLIPKALSSVDKPVCVTEPEVDTIWNVGDGAEAIALGAGTFGQRLANKLPTYFDTLPKLEVFAETSRGGEWEPVVRSTVTPGGEAYRTVIQRQFALPKGQIELNAHLQLHDGENRSKRKTSFRFPRGPSRQMPLDLHVEVRPAGGLAVVEIVPEDREFLGGVQIFLDYEDMEPFDELPEEDLGWPPIKPPHTAVTETQFSSRSYHNLLTAINQYLEIDIEDQAYDTHLRLLQKAISQAIGSFNHDTRRWTQYRIVDVDGKATSPVLQDLVKRVSDRIGHDFSIALDDSRSGIRSRRSHDMEKHRDRLIVVGTWLFRAVPDSIRTYLLSEVKKDRPLPSKFVHPAGRIFHDRDEILLFFQSMYKFSAKRQHHERWYTISWLYAAKRLLNSSDEAALSLTRELIADTYRGLFEDLVSWIETGKVNGFGATLQLLFFLFRYRMAERNFLSGHLDEEESELRKMLIETVEDSSEKVSDGSLALTRGRKATALDVLDGLTQFLDYRGSLQIIEKLSEFVPTDES